MMTYRRLKSPPARGTLSAAARLVAVALAVGCVSAPSPTAGQLALTRNARAHVSGRVVDSQGAAVAGIRVQAIPRGRDVPWSPPSVTDAEGAFALTLFAPAAYGFLLREGDATVITADSNDPSLAFLVVSPGERRAGIELVFLRDQWNAILGK
jgi:hypothetical protein